MSKSGAGNIKVNLMHPIVTETTQKETHTYTHTHNEYVPNRYRS